MAAPGSAALGRAKAALGVSTAGGVGVPHHEQVATPNATLAGNRAKMRYRFWAQYSGELLRSLGGRAVPGGLLWGWVEGRGAVQAPAAVLMSAAPPRCGTGFGCSTHGGCCSTVAAALLQQHCCGTHVGCCGGLGGWRSNGLNAAVWHTKQMKKPQHMTVCMQTTKCILQHPSCCRNCRFLQHGRL